MRTIYISHVIGMKLLCNIFDPGKLGGRVARKLRENDKMEVRSGKSRKGDLASHVRMLGADIRNLLRPYSFPPTTSPVPSPCRPENFLLPTIAHNSEASDLESELFNNPSIDTSIEKLGEPLSAGKREMQSLKNFRACAKLALFISSVLFKS